MVWDRPFSLSVGWLWKYYRSLSPAERSVLFLYFAFPVAHNFFCLKKKKSLNPTPHITLVCIKFLSAYLNLSVLSFWTSWRNSFQNLRPALVWTGFSLTQLWPWDLPYCQPGKSSWCQILDFLDPIFPPFSDLLCFGGTYSLVLSWDRVLGGIYIFWVSAIHISGCPLEFHWMSLRHLRWYIQIEMVISTPHSQYKASCPHSFH